MRWVRQVVLPRMSSGALPEVPVASRCGTDTRTGCYVTLGRRRCVIGISLHGSHRNLLPSVQPAAHPRFLVKVDTREQPYRVIEKLAQSCAAATVARRRGIDHHALARQVLGEGVSLRARA